MSTAAAAPSASMSDLADADMTQLPAEVTRFPILGKRAMRALGKS